MNNEQKIGAVFLILFITAMFAPSILPKTTMIGQFFARLGATGSLILVVTILAMLQIKGKAPFSFAEAAKGTNWEMIIMFAATMPVAEAMSSEKN